MTRIRPDGQWALDCRIQTQPLLLRLRDEWMTRTHCNASDLARGLGMSPQQFWNWCRGARQPPWLLILRLAGWLGYDVRLGSGSAQLVRFEPDVPEL